MSIAKALCPLAEPVDLLSLKTKKTPVVQESFCLFIKRIVVVVVNLANDILDF